MSARATDVVWRDLVFIVIGIHQPTKRHLALIVHAEDAVRFSFRLAEGREQHACKDGDDRDDDQELDQSECLPLPVLLGSRIHILSLRSSSNRMASEFLKGEDTRGEALKKAIRLLGGSVPSV